MNLSKDFIAERSHWIARKKSAGFVALSDFIQIYNLDYKTFFELGLLTHKTELTRDDLIMYKVTPKGENYLLDSDFQEVVIIPSTQKQLLALVQQGNG
ncbi:hypothetical protein [Echinimonas agarilytica]|uniref:Uncharacterized protein n=1 Tax=Echinimonas agarilytica TaxID=1215918 RepID=A0AA41WB91_9GAMM|nr:hypothetical protein [Echinimonas agarilytica]MCM2681243.1 hypothetical protein [Echinimonas agarilytica]